MIKRFISDIKKYWAYSKRAGKSELKSEVASSHLSWLWWVLDPLLFMLVYSFVSLVVFGKSEKYFSAFVFVGYTAYQFFSKSLKSSVKLVASNKTIIKNIYLPKFVLLMNKTYVNLFTSAISFVLVFISMAIYRVPLSWRMILFIPLLLLLVLLSVALSTFLMNWGVYVEDLGNVVNVLTRLLFYLSGVFYSLESRIDEGVGKFVLTKCNPVAFIIIQMRNVLLYNKPVDWGTYFIWMAISIVLLLIGVSVIYKNENGYAKVV